MSKQILEAIEAIGSVAAVPTILDVICRTTGMGFAAVARVTEDRWIACSVKDDISFGLKPGGELALETTICNEIRQHRTAVVIDHVAEDAVFQIHSTPAMYGFQSYISMPIVLPDGTFFGTLCAIDPRPAELNKPEVIGMFKLFADLIAFHLDALQRVAASQADLADERETAKLRDQFIAVLGHDLRNPLAAIDAGTRLLRREPQTETSGEFLRLIQTTVIRMSDLIDNVLDFARGRLGGGLALSRNGAVDLEPVLTQVVSELRAIHPQREIATAFDLAVPVNCDRTRIAQILSNLLGNALTHGAVDQPIQVTASTSNGVFELSVTNAGEAIAPAAMERLFTPFARGEVKASQQGLGLGLFIASEVARAHGGTLTVTSRTGETRFTFRMPL